MYINEEMIMSKELQDHCYETTDAFGGVQKLYQFPQCIWELVLLNTNIVTDGPTRIYGN